MSKPAYKRILLKLSGESLAGDAGFGINGHILDDVAAEIKQIVDQGVQLGIVIGGGNFFRGMQAAAKGMDRIGSDYIGMLATAMNGLALQQALEAQGQTSRVLSALHIVGVAEPYIRSRALKHLSANKVVIFSAGTGNPMFTTDTAASLRGLEINADVVIKATRVDGVYDSDPEKNPDAKRFDTLTYEQVIEQNLGVMDLTAITLCRENKMPIQVLNFHEKGNLLRAVSGEHVGTIISAKAS
ncbi:MAG: UMP kinase [Arenicellales bacterium]